MAKDDIQLTRWKLKRVNFKQFKSKHKRQLKQKINETILERL